MQGVSGGVECLPDPFDQPLHVRERWDTADIDPVHETALPATGIAGGARDPNTRVVPARRLARLAKIPPGRRHVEKDISRNQDNVTGKLRQVGLHHEGVRRCSIHSDSQTLIPQRGQWANRGDKYLPKKATRFKERHAQEGSLQGAASSTFRITTSTSLAHSHAADSVRL